MNLERISIKVSDELFMTLAKISDFSKLYLTILFDQDLTIQKINTGDSVLAFNFKNIEQFKGTRPFKTYNQDELLDLYKTYGTSFLYQTKLHFGDLVRYNGLKYVVLGVVVNTYAQWNMPTPLLFNPTNVNNDYKSLYGSRLTDEQINNKINDNFQAGKYDADMVIPLVDANDFSEYITVIQPRPTKEEVELMFDSVKAEKDLTIKSQKDVFIDTMLRLRGNEINQIKEVNEDLFKGVQTLLLSVNKAVNEQIELLPEPVVEKPARKPRAKKVIEEVIEEIEPREIVLDDLPDFIDSEILVKNMPVQVLKLALLRMKEEDEDNTFTDNDTLTTLLNWSKTPEKEHFWEEIHIEGDLRRFKKKYGNKGELVDELIAKSELPKAQVKETQEVKAVELIFYPPKGGVLSIKTDSLYELYDVCVFILTKLKIKKLKLNFNLYTDLGTHRTQIEFNSDYSQDELLWRLIEKYDTFVKPELNWKNFDERQGDIDLIHLNKKIVNGALEPEPKPVEVEKPKSVPVEKPKQVKVEKPKQIKVTKPKVEDDLSFLNDLENIF